ncbi:hypothetical protein [Streptomyces brevispora]
MPEGVVDETTGELRDAAWQGWIVDDPYYPTWPTPPRADERLPEAVCG